MDHVIFDFLRRIAIGAGTVLAILLLVRFGIPRRSATAAIRRTTN